MIFTLTDLAMSAPVTGRVQVNNSDSEFIVGVAGRPDHYDAALTSIHLIRLRVAGSLADRDILQVGACQIVQTNDEQATLGVFSRFALLRNDSQVSVSLPSAEAAAIATEALSGSGVPLSAPIEPDTGGGVSSVIVGSGSHRADLHPAPIRSILNQVANLVGGWWHERWTGGVQISTYIRRNSVATFATIGPAWGVQRAGSRAGRVYGLVRNQATTRGPGAATRTEAINRVYRINQVLNGVDPDRDSAMA